MIISRSLACFSMFLQHMIMMRAGPSCQTDWKSKDERRAGGVLGSGTGTCVDSVCWSSAETTADHWSLVPAVTGATRVITTWLLILSSDTLITVLYHQRKQMVLKGYLCRILIDWSWIFCHCINVWNIFDKYFWSPLGWAGLARCQNTGANWNKWSYSDRSKQPIQFYPGGIKPSQALNETGESCPGCWSKGGRFIQRARERREHGGSGARIIYIGW